MNKKKILVLAMSFAMVAILAIGGTIAYFTDVTEVKENVFTVGNVEIRLDEPSWDSTGKEDAPSVYAGEALAKDPIVTNIGDNPCFVRVKVTGLDALGEAGMITYETGYQAGKLGENWVKNGDYFYYLKPLCTEETKDDEYNSDLAVVTTKLFEQIRMPLTLTAENATEEFYHVDVVAEAVQAQGAKPSWSNVKNMTIDEIVAWFDTCME